MKVRPLAAVVGLSVAAAVLIAPLQVAAATRDFPAGNEGHWYTQTNGEPDPSLAGYEVRDDSLARMWSEFQRLGGVAVLGYPVSGLFPLSLSGWQSLGGGAYFIGADAFMAQAFQKAVLQWDPAKQTVEFVNVLDVLHDMGKDAYLQAARQIPPPADTSADQGKSWPDVVAAHEALLNGNDAIRQAYFADPDALDHYGLPMTGPVDEGNVIVVRAQRTVFQQWKQDTPWAAAGQVTMANVGDIAKEAGLLTAADPPAHPQVEWIPGAGPVRYNSWQIDLQPADVPAGFVPSGIDHPNLPSSSTTPRVASDPTLAAAIARFNQRSSDLITLLDLHALVNGTYMWFFKDEGGGKGSGIVDVSLVFHDPAGASWAFGNLLYNGTNAVPTPVGGVGDQAAGYSIKAGTVPGTTNSAACAVYQLENVAHQVCVSHPTATASLDEAVGLAKATVLHATVPGAQGGIPGAFFTPPPPSPTPAR